MKAHKRKHKKQIRKAFKTRCRLLNQKARSIGLNLHWSRSRGEPRQTSTFSIWPPHDFEHPIIVDLNLDQAEEYIRHYYKLKAFL
jgi:hypothetical protein